MTQRHGLPGSSLPLISTEVLRRVIQGVSAEIAWPFPGILIDGHFSILHSQFSPLLDFMLLLLSVPVLVHPANVISRESEPRLFFTETVPESFHLMQTSGVVVQFHQLIEPLQFLVH